MAPGHLSAAGAEWSGAEIRTLARLYPMGGMRACAPALLGRSVRAIYTAAHELGMSRAGQKPGRGKRS